MRNLIVAVTCVLAVSACVTHAVSNSANPVVAPKAQQVEVQPANSSLSYATGPQIRPIYPGFDAIYGIQGTAVLMVLVAPDGKVTNVSVEKSAGDRQLDRAAINAARQWRFIPGRKNGVAQAGYARIPFKFSVDDPLLPVDWPMNYIHPRYVLDTQPMPYASVDDALLSVTTGRVSMEVIPSLKSQMFVIRDNKGTVHEWWIFSDMDTEFAIALRYTFADTGIPTAPEIGVSALCRSGVAFCDSRASWFLRGPLFAKGLPTSAEKSP